MLKMLQRNILSCAQLCRGMHILVLLHFEVARKAETWPCSLVCLCSVLCSSLSFANDLKIKKHEHMHGFRYNKFFRLQPPHHRVWGQVHCSYLIISILIFISFISRLVFVKLSSFNNLTSQLLHPSLLRPASQFLVDKFAQKMEKMISCTHSLKPL